MHARPLETRVHCLKMISYLNSKKEATVDNISHISCVHRGLKLKTSSEKLLNLAHYFPYGVKLRLLAHSRSFLANQKARNAIVGAENLLNNISHISCVHT